MSGVFLDGKRSVERLDLSAHKITVGMAAIRHMDIAIRTSASPAVFSRPAPSDFHLYRSLKGSPRDENVICAVNHWFE